MKKAIIILSILSLIAIGYTTYQGYLYIESINNLDEVITTKSELLDQNMKLEKEYQDLQDEYDKKSHDILDDNLECKQWKNVEEVLKQTEE